MHFVSEENVKGFLYYHHLNVNRVIFKKKKNNNTVLLIYVHLFVPDVHVHVILLNRRKPQL